jgi:hypothetical protein
MKLFMKAILSLLICSLGSYALASTTFQITCDQDVAKLSNIFVENQWSRGTMPWYAAWAHDDMDNNLFVGGMRTIKDKYPKDPNPHLSFLNPTVEYDEERGEILTCSYKINNREMMDIGNVLEMRTSDFSLPQGACYVSSPDTITCNQ